MFVAYFLTILPTAEKSRDLTKLPSFLDQILFGFIASLCGKSAIFIDKTLGISFFREPLSGAVDDRFETEEGDTALDDSGVRFFGLGRDMWKY